MKRAPSRAGSDSSYHHGDLKAALIASAGKLLERDGAEGISLRGVARATGVSQTAPYNHFADKEHLLVALAASGFNKLTALQVAAADHSRDARKKIVAIGCAYVSFARAHPQLYRLMFGVGIADWGAHPEVEQIKHASYVPVQKALAAYLGADTATETEALGIVNVAAWALVHGLSMLIIDGALTSASETSGDLDALVEEVIKRFVKGLSR